MGVSKLKSDNTALFLAWSKSTGCSVYFEAERVCNGCRRSRGFQKPISATNAVNALGAHHTCSNDQFDFDCNSKGYLETVMDEWCYYEWYATTYANKLMRKFTVPVYLWDCLLSSKVTSYYAIPSSSLITHNMLPLSIVVYLLVDGYSIHHPTLLIVQGMYIRMLHLSTLEYLLSTLWLVHSYQLQIPSPPRLLSKGAIKRKDVLIPPGIILPTCRQRKYAVQWSMLCILEMQSTFYSPESWSMHFSLLHDLPIQLSTWATAGLILFRPLHIYYHGLVPDCCNTLLSWTCIPFCNTSRHPYPRYNSILSISNCPKLRWRSTCEGRP